MFEKSKNTLFLAVLVVCNFLDTFFTVKYIKFGPLSEANPFMDYLLTQDVCLFVFFKIFFVNIFAFILYYNRNRQLCSIFLIFFTILYILLTMLWILLIFFV